MRIIIINIFIFSAFIDGICINLPNLFSSEKTDSIKIKALIRRARELTTENYDSSLFYANKALRLSKKMDYKNGIEWSYYQLASTYFYRSKYQEALRNNLALLKIEEETKDTLNIANCLIQIGNIYYALEELNTAFEYYRKAHDLSSQIGDEAGLSYCLVNMANIYDLYKQDKKKAIEFYLKALDISIKISEMTNIAVIHNNLGGLYLDEKNYEEAWKYFELALEENKEITLPYYNALIYHNIGDYFFTVKQYEKALTYLSLSYDVAEQHNHYLRVKDVAYSLSEVYLAMKDFKKAYEYYLLSDQLNDSIANEKSVKKMKELVDQYEYDKIQKEEEIKSLILEKKERIKQILAGSGVIFIIMTTGFLFYRQKSRIKQAQIEKQFLKEDLEFKNKDLVTKTLYLTKTNELISDILDKLKTLKYNLKKENQKSVQPIINELQTSLKNEIWEEFEMRFNQVYSDFYNKLNKKFPDLTPNEKRLCAFLRLNMTTKEISSITHQSLESIRVARIRLRKKLNISNENIGLINFLSRI